MEPRTQAKSLPRHRYTSEQKLAMIEKAAQAGSSMSQVARKYGVAPSQLYLWTKFMTQGAQAGGESEEIVVPVSEVRQLQAKIRELERVLGRKSMENEILKEAVALAKKKTDLAYSIATRGRFPVRAVFAALGVARSNLHGRFKEPQR